MKIQPSNSLTLGEFLKHSGRAADGIISGANGCVGFKEIVEGTCFQDNSVSFCGRSVLLATADQLTTALALVKLDGLANRVVLCPHDTDPQHFKSIISDAQIDTVVCGENFSDVASLGLPIGRAHSTVDSQNPVPIGRRRTEWVLLSSGTTGSPKLVLHDLASLISPIMQTTKAVNSVVWATFYDIRRYGGLQIFLRAIVGRCSMILSHAGEAVGAHLARLKQHGVTYVSGTPSHWRRVLMSGAANTISPVYVRLSGEIVDQNILDALHATYPGAAISHAYASTEAGVGFNVIDGKEGFPATLIDGHDPNADVLMRVEDGSLRIRSKCTAYRYLGNDQPSLISPDGFVDTGDLVDLRGDRYYFIGRRESVINVGGLKVHPEEVEMVINKHPAVQKSLVRGRRNPITGALVVADILLKQRAQLSNLNNNQELLAEDILNKCRAVLPKHKVPAKVRFVSQLDVSATGKLVRDHE